MKNCEFRKIIRENINKKDLELWFQKKYAKKYNQIIEFNNNLNISFEQKAYNYAYKKINFICKHCQKERNFLSFNKWYEKKCNNLYCPWKRKKEKIKKEKVKIINYKKYSKNEEVEILNKSSKISPFNLKNKYPTIHQNIIDYNKNLNLIKKTKFSSLVYNYKNDYIPIGCKICWKATKYYNKTKYNKFCSNKCFIKSEEFLVNRINTLKEEENSKKRSKKYKETCLKKYWVENVSKIKWIIEKRKITISNKTEIEKNLIKFKILITNIVKYWFIHHNKNKLIWLKIKNNLLNKTNKEKEQILQKKKQTNFEKYWVEHIMHLEESKIKIRKTLFNNFFEKLKELVNINLTFNEYLKKGRKWIYKMECKKCKTEFEDYLNYNWLPRCPNCFPLKVSLWELWIRNLLNNYNLELNSRKIISPYEIDVYLPEKKLAIEYNWLLFHSYWKDSDWKKTWFSAKFFNNWKTENKKYHLNKTEESEKLWIQLLHVFENEWKDENKQKIWKSIISSKLWIIDNRIYARKCQIRIIEEKEKKEFLEKNHLQWNDNSKIKIWLYYKNELVQLMTFWKSRYNKEINWEIHRLVTKRNCIVLWWVSKIFKHFKDEYLKEWETIITYADRRYSQGKIYEQLWFEFSHNSEPNFFYFKLKEQILYSRLKFQKHKLKNILEKYDEKLSASENMFNNNYRRIWDCWNKVFKYKKR